LKLNETDFARHEDFAGLAKNIAMQIASNPIFQWFHQTTFQNQQKKCSIRKWQEDLQNKPEEIRNKIVELRRV
jgi:translation elongation factor EF-Ts